MGLPPKFYEIFLGTKIKIDTNKGTPFSLELVLN